MRFGNDEIVHDSLTPTSVADGVIASRRSVLRLSGATLAAAFSLAACRSSAPRRAAGVPPIDSSAPPGTLELAEYIAELFPRARRFVAAGGPLEEAYLMGVAEITARLQTPTVDDLDVAMNALAAEAGVARQALELDIVIYDLEPGKGFEHHDHRDCNGVILGVEGEVGCRNYDIVGDNMIPPKGETFQIRQTRDDLILPGRFSSLSRTRENVHDVTAGPEGGKVLDVFTVFNKDADSYYMDVDPKPRDAARGIYDATWR